MNKCETCLYRLNKLMCPRCINFDKYESEDKAIY